ncbi:MAG TPA: hypothetical protein VFF88_07420, partial [Methylocella sp.]|nr:hypothetical protein [Methylocella sp.]
EAMPAVAEGEEPGPHQARSPALPGEAEGAPALGTAPGIAPLANGANGAGAAAEQHPPVPGGGIGAEMRALADALAAEMGEAEARPAAGNGEAHPKM